MELTQEYFDRQLEKLASKDDLQSQTKELTDYIHDSFEKQQEYIDERVTEIMEQNKVKEDVAMLKRELAQIKTALHLS
jgi:ribosomal protein L29